MHSTRIERRGSMAMKHKYHWTIIRPEMLCFTFFFKVITEVSQFPFHFCGWGFGVLWFLAEKVFAALSLSSVSGALLVEKKLRAENRCFHGLYGIQVQGWFVLIECINQHRSLWGPDESFLSHDSFSAHRYFSLSVCLPFPGIHHNHYQGYCSKHTC